MIFLKVIAVQYIRLSYCMHHNNYNISNFSTKTVLVFTADTRCLLRINFKQIWILVKKKKFHKVNNKIYKMCQCVLIYVNKVTVFMQ